MNQGARQTSGRAWAALTVAFAAAMAPLAPSALAVIPWEHSGWSPASWWAHATDPIIPPPLQGFVREFAPLYRGYQAIPAPKLCTFSEWLVMHGVIEPVKHRAMMALYLLFENAAREW